MSKKRNYVLSIAGFDPSSGAGISADIKTFEAHKTYGLGVITSNTIQTENSFQKCIWIDKNIIKEQINILFKEYKIDFVKIGIIQNWNVLNEIIDFLLEKNNRVKIFWDPVLESETGFNFNEKDDELLDIILNKIFLFTPNYKEIENIFKGNSIDDFLKEKSKITNIFLKGGHRDDNKKYYDYLYKKNDKIYSFRPKIISEYPKHGSGCVISSSICANNSLGFNLIKSCLKAKQYTNKFLLSNKTLLGYHKYRS